MRALDASRRLRRESRHQWVAAAVRVRLRADVANVRPLRLRDPDDEGEVAALLAVADDLGADA